MSGVCCQQLLDLIFSATSTHAHKQFPLKDHNNNTCTAHGHAGQVRTQREILAKVLTSEAETFEVGASQFIKKINTAYNLSCGLTSLLVSKVVEACQRVKQLKKTLTNAMHRVLSLALPDELARAREFRAEVLALRDVMIDTEFELEQLEARKRHVLRRGMSQTKLQVHFSLSLIVVLAQTLSPTLILAELETEDTNRLS